MTEELEKMLFQTFGDKILSRAQKQSFKEHLRENPPDASQTAFLRSRLFDWVRSGMQGHENHLLLDWLEEANKMLVNTPESKSETNASEKVLFSPGEECRREIIGQINGAGKALHICVFTISDDQITQALLAAHRRGVSVRLISDDDKMHDTGSDIRQLAQVGIQVKVDRTPFHMHHKFAVIDAQTVLTGSYNWTRSAALHNHENILVTSTKSVVEAFLAEFDILWPQMQEV